MEKGTIKLIAIILSVVLLLVGINHCQDNRAKKENERATVAVTEKAEQNGYTVYVSRNGKIHRNPNCSGMIYYKEMGYYDARRAGYDLCQNCYQIRGAYCASFFLPIGAL